MVNPYESVDANKRKSFVVVSLFSLFIFVATYFLAQAFAVIQGYEIGGLGYFGLALIISGLSSFGGYYFSDKIILGISGARPANGKSDFLFYTVAENLSLASGIPVPALYVIDDTAPNAFATGRDVKHAAIAATRGLLDKLNRTELEGVVAHELSHIKNYDMLLMSVVSVMVGTVALMADLLLRTRLGRNSDNDDNKLGAVFLILGLIFAILSPFVAQLIQLAISRRREFLADAGSVMLTRQPQGLISALKKISADHEPLEVANKATAHLYIANPFKDHARGGVGWFSGLFLTHPPIEARLAALNKMIWDSCLQLPKDDFRVIWIYGQER